MEVEILKTLEKLKSFIMARYPELRQHVHDVISFAYIEYKTGRDLRTNFKYIVCDYKRDELGGKNIKRLHYSLDQMTEDKKNQHLLTCTEEEDDQRFDLLVELVKEALKPFHKDVVLLYLKGFSKKKIAAKYGCSAAYISYIFKLSQKKMKNYARRTSKYKSLVDD